VHDLLLVGFPAGERVEPGVRGCGRHEIESVRRSIDGHRRGGHHRQTRQLEVVLEAEPAVGLDEIADGERRDRTVELAVNDGRRGWFIRSPIVPDDLARVRHRRHEHDGDHEAVHRGVRQRRARSVPATA
jgi:hypothetical protein